MADYDVYPFLYIPVFFFLNCIYGNEVEPELVEAELFYKRAFSITFYSLLHKYEIYNTGNYWYLGKISKILFLRYS